MPTWPRAVEIGEVGPRDGLQNEATVAIDDRIRLIDALSGTGLRRIEAVSFVSPEGDPGDGRRGRGDGRDHPATRRRLPGARAEREGGRARARGRRRRDRGRGQCERDPQPAECEALGGGVVDRGGRAERARPRCRHAGRRRSSRPRSGVRTRATSPRRGSPIVAAQLRDGGVDRLSFGDTTGMATPRRVHTLLDALPRSGSPRPTISLHFHNTAWHRARERARRARSRRHALRRVDRWARRMSVRAGRDRQHRHRGPRPHARGHGNRRPAWTSTR